MNRFIFPVYRILVPKPVRTFILKKQLRRKIIGYFSKLPLTEINEEQRELLSFLEKNQVTLFPYPFDSKYIQSNVDVFEDKTNGLKYVIQSGKRLYFKKRWNKARIRTAYSALAKEQDPASPHCYLSDNFTLGSNDVIVDIGAAEGNFALSQIENVKKIYLFDYDKEWIEAMKATFAPWKEKVEIIPKYVSDRDDDKNTTLNTFYLTHKDVTFLKIDVEGFEKRVLTGASELLKGSGPLKIAICTYHKYEDEEELTHILKESSFSVTPSHGYMIPLFDKKIKSPWIRRVLVRAVR